MEIQIQKESTKCLKCSTVFRHEQKHHSLLKIEEGVFLREDYCEDCWRERSNSAPTDDIYSFWETKYCDPAIAKATPHEQFSPLLNLCYESIAEGAAEAEAMAYMCALILRRQKVFRFVREESDQPSGKSVLIFFDKHNETQIRIVDPQMTDSQMQEVKNRLEGILSPEESEVDGDK